MAINDPTAIAVINHEKMAASSSSNCSAKDADDPRPQRGETAVSPALVKSPQLAWR
jgi:hypothetical protein